MTCIYPGTYGLMYTKYEVSISNSAARRVCTDDINDANDDDDATTDKHDCVRLFG